MSTPTPARHSPISSVPDRVLSPRAPSAADARRAARREHLRDFYGLKRDGGASPTSPTPPTASTPTQRRHVPERTRSMPERSRSGASGASAAAPATSGTGPAASADARAAAERRDLSSPNFVAAEYYEDLIARAGLPELLRTTSNLATDIGRLHSSRHTLVYNHHHQLFSAGDTISVLNTRTPQLLSIVTDLQERFSEMSQLADSVALPEPSAADEGERTRAVAQQGIERLRLMDVAGESGDARRAAWRRIEEMLKGQECEGLEALMEEGRAAAGIE